MFIGIGTPIPIIANLPGPSRPGSGGSSFAYTPIDNSFSMEFDGSSSIYFAGDIDTLTAAPSFSISVWIKPTVVPIPTTEYIFSKYLANGDRIEIYIGGNGATFVNSSGNTLSYRSQSFLQTGVPAPVNGWYHLAMVFDGSQTDSDLQTQNNKRLKCYVNGVASTTNVTSNQQTQSANLTNRYAYIGTRNRFNTVAPDSGVYDGYIDELAIFAQPLSEETIQAIYDATINNPGKVANLNQTPGAEPAAWYRMGD